MGKLSPELAVEVAEKLQLTDNQPCAYHIRYTGCKGVVAWWPDKKEDCIKLSLRPSMNKFESEHTVLEYLFPFCRFLTSSFDYQILFKMVEENPRDVANDTDVVYGDETLPHFLHIRYDKHMVENYLSAEAFPQLLTATFGWKFSPYHGITSCPSARFIVLFDSSHHSGAKSADPEVDFLVRSAAPVMTEATTVATVTTTVVIPADVSKDKSAPHPSVFGSSSSSENTDHTLSLFIGRSGSGFAAGSIRAEEVIGAGLEEIYVPKWTVTKGFELNEGHSCANMIDHFTPLTFFKTVRRMKHEQLFAEFNVSAACNLSLSSEVRMRVEYNILEKRKWKSLAEEKDYLLGARDKEMEELKSQLLKAKEESVEVAQLRAQVSGLEATENSLRGEVTSTKEHNVLLEQECDSLKLKVMSLESTIAEKDHELSDLGASSSSLKSQNQSLVNQVHELETSSTDLCEKLEMYEESLKQLEEFQDNLMRPLETRLAEIHADFTRCCMRFQESFHPHLLNIIAGRRWLLAHGMKLLVVKCLNSTEYMEALRDAFGQADFNSAIRDLRGLNFLLLQELSNKKDASKWDIMDLLCLDDAVAETLAFSVALDIFRRRVEKMERNLVERLPFLKDVFVSIDYPLSAEALIEPPVEVPATNVLSTVVIVPHSGPLVFVEDYDNPDLADVVSENVTSGPEGEEKIDASAGGDLAFSQLDDEARDAVL
ncbi:gypsy type transposase [Tanacetum coccineum]